jgi:predicted nucleotidyltransferase
MAQIADVNTIVDGFCRALGRRGIRNGRVFLFGSWSRGEQRDDSDIDVAIVSPDFASMNYWARIEAIAIAVAAVRAPIEAVAFTPEEFQDSDRPIAAFAKAGIEINLSSIFAAV